MPRRAARRGRPEAGRALLARLLSDEGVEVVAHETKRLHLAAAALGLAPPRRVFDAMLASYVARPGPPRPRPRRGRPGPPRPRPVGRSPRRRTSRGATPSRPPPSSRRRPGAPTSARARASRSPCARRSPRSSPARPASLRRSYEEIELPLVPVLARMELAGIAVDRAPSRDLGRPRRAPARARAGDLRGRGRGVQRQLAAAARPDPLREARLPRPEEDGEDEDLLDRLEVSRSSPSAACPLPGLVLEYREISKLKGTYVDALPGSSPTRRARPHLASDQTVAATGRLSSSDPNLQNIPIRTAAGREIRRAFVAPPGPAARRRRLLADRAAHPRAPLGRRGAHRRPSRRSRTSTARRPRRSSASSPRPGVATRCARGQDDQLRRCSTAWAPSRSPRSSASRTAEAKTLHRGLLRAVSRACAAASTGSSRRRGETREVTTLFGRVRPIPEIAASNPDVRANAERMALNAPFQGTAADIIKIAMIRLDAALAAPRLCGAALAAGPRRARPRARRGRRSPRRRPREGDDGGSARPSRSRSRSTSARGANWAAAK